jgi:hypothetical protein
MRMGLCCGRGGAAAPNNKIIMTSREPCPERGDTGQSFFQFLADGEKPSPWRTETVMRSASSTMFVSETAAAFGGAKRKRLLGGFRTEAVIWSMCK